MKNLILAFGVVLAFSTMAMASDIAFYVGQWNTDGWYDASQFKDVDTIIAETGGLFKDIQRFDDAQLNELGAWADKNTDDGEMDIIWLNGTMPSVLYQFPNVNPDGSRAEKWLDGGNMIINVGDWFAYCSYEGGPRRADNGGSGAANILDLSSGIIVSADGTQMKVTPTGKEYLPSLNDPAKTDRPVVLAEVRAPWEVAAIFASLGGTDDPGAETRADPVVIHNTATDGYVAFINQAAGGPGGWIADRGLTCAEFIGNWVSTVIGLGAQPLARRPNPKDGALHEDTWITLSWIAGDFAVSHDVYLGDNFDDVNNGTGGTFRGNQVGTFYVAGFPGFAYPDGLVPGTTYYWRIDEVNTANPSSPWKGAVWSFSIPSKKARNPVPADGSKFIDPATATLSWTAGFGAKLHTVYFGDNSDTVANAAGGVPQGVTTYKPGVLEAEKTYYWRVDEFDAVNTHKGDVWSFTTAKAGGGVKGQYYKGMDFNTLVLTRVDPQINFSWGGGAPDPVVGVDSFSVRWTGEVEAAFTETYTFYARADDGVRLWVDGKQLVNAWIDQGATEYGGKVDLVAGNTYSVQMEMYENGGDAVAELRWSSPHTPKQFVPQAALSPPVKASAPKPGNGATGTSLTPVLTWNAGDFAASHDVYFGTAADAVRNATKTSPEYKGSKAKGAESYSPGKLAWQTTYYWRVDEVNNVNANSPWVGNVWSFTTGDFLLVDDFESYDAGANQIWYAWHDGLGYGAPGSPPYFAGNGTGAAVGDETTPSFTEQTIVHGGKQAMPLNYDNNKQGSAKYSEAEFKLTAPRDWTEESVGELSIWFRGRAGSVGSLAEAPAGTYTMTASGADIWGSADQFHYAYKTLTGAGSIVARVQSVQNTDGWAKAGVMIRETLTPGSKHAFAAITPSNGVASQGRDTTDAASFNTNQTGVTAPRWLKLERDAAGNFTVSHSTNGTAWSPVTGATPRNIPMSSTVYIGLALTAHNANATCQAVFTNVTTTGTVSPQWAHQDIGIASNAAEPLYVAVSNAAGQPAVVVHPDPKAAQITTWTEWVIPLSGLSAQGITLTNVDKLAVGLGTKGNMTTAGGSGKMYFDDIRLYRPRTAP